MRSGTHLCLPLLLITTFLAAFASPRPVLAATQVVEQSEEYIFGESITFHAVLQSDMPVEKVDLFIDAEGNTQTLVLPAVITPQEELVYQVGYDYDLRLQPLRAFSRISYRYEVALQAGQTFTSPTYTFYYEDNRFAWLVLEEQPFRVHWHEGGNAFGQKALDVAQDSLQRVQSLLPLSEPRQVDIYVYANATELQSTLALSQKDWVAGHADPDLGVMVVALPAGPDQRLLMEQRIPHELMHVLLYQHTGPVYPRLPTWLNEGLASAAELYPNPDYQILLENARQKSSLLPMASLCHTFPRDASSALLAYAQAASFTRYLHNRFGTTGMQTLVSSYAGGVGCEQGLAAAFGESLSQLERQWRRDILAENLALTALANLLPWLVLLLAPLAAPLFLMLFRLRAKTFGEQGTGD